MASTKSFTSALLAAAVAIGSLGPLASAANARDWDRGGRGGDDRRMEQRYDGGRNAYRRDYRGNRWRDSGYRRHRDHTGRNVAIGAFAAIVGLAIAAEASRNRDRYYGY